MAVTAASLLAELEKLRTTYGGEAAAARLDLLRRLEKRRLDEPEDLLSLHECLCFLRAYPDGPEVLALVERMLEGFDRRSDMRRNARWLEQTAVAGTDIHFSFFWFTARWLARRWPESLHVDWSFWDPSRQKRMVDEVLPLIVPYSETPGLDMMDLTPREWLAQLKGPGEGDAAFLIRRFETLPGDGFTRESLWESLDVPLTLKPGPTTPARTKARYARSPAVFHAGPLDRKRPDLHEAVLDAPRAVRRVAPREADRLIDLTRAAMVNRHRDLYSFSHADRNDVHLVEAGDGLQFVCIGTTPERRLVVEALYGFLTLKNGVPVGYVLTSSLFSSTEIAYNVFESFRGGEAARVFGRVLAMARRLFGARSFSIDPYQLGYGNKEGLQSGAWWFYYKLGFRPRDPEIRRLARAETARMKKDPGHRSDLETLERLASEHLFLDIDARKGDGLGGLELGNIGLHISALLARRFGAERERGIDACSEEAARLLGVRSMRRFSPGERLWWRRWSPLVLLLPGVKRWTTEQKRDLVRVIRAKGGTSELAFVRRFDAHPRLRRALLKLTEEA